MTTSDSLKKLLLATYNSLGGGRLFDNSTGGTIMGTTLAPGVAFELLQVRLHLNAVGGAAENFTVTMDANAGTPYDSLLLSRNMNSLADLVWTPEDGPLHLEAGDEIDFAWTNSNAKTWGLTVVYRKEGE